VGKQDKPRRTPKWYGNTTNTYHGDTVYNPEQIKKLKMLGLLKGDNAAEARQTYKAWEGFTDEHDQAIRNDPFTGNNPDTWQGAWLATGVPANGSVGAQPGVKPPGPNPNLPPHVVQPPQGQYPSPVLPYSSTPPVNPSGPRGPQQVPVPAPFKFPQPTGPNGMMSLLNAPAATQNYSPTSLTPPRGRRRYRDGRMPGSGLTSVTPRGFQR